MSKRKSENKGTALVSSVSVAAVATLVAFGPINVPKPPKVYPGPYFAQVLKVTDSDTLKLLVHTWPDTTITVGLREFGVDTPEIFRPKCPLEKIKAKAASDYVKALIPVGSTVTVSNVITGKYARRAVGTIHYEGPSGPDTLGNTLIRNKHAVAYFGKTKVKDWCAK